MPRLQANRPQANEQVVRLQDHYRQNFAEYAEDCLRIVDKNGELVPFKLNRAQRRVNALMDERIERGKPVRLYLLKARQLGFSTWAQGRAYHTTSLNKNRTALIVSHSVQSASSLFDKSKVFQIHVPPELRPMQKLNNRRELHFENPDSERAADQPGLNSRLIVQTADDKHLGASMTLHFVHLSEFARYEHIQTNIAQAMATLIQSVPKRKGTAVIIETTAQGFGYAKDFWDDSKNAYDKIFVSWVADDDYRVDDPLAVADLSPIEETRYGNEVEARERVTQELKFWYPEEAQDEAWVEREALCRLAWRRKVIDEDFKGELALFRQEYPLYAEEAFLTSGANVFDQRKLYDIREQLIERDADGRVLGEVRKPETYRFDKQQRQFYAAPFGTLTVYEKPQKGRQYVIGADAAEGLTRGDFAAATVLKLPDLKQVAVFHEQMPPDDFAYCLYALSRTYNDAWLNPEWNGPGQTTVLLLSRDLYYPYMYSREEFDSVERRIVLKYGFHTNRMTKQVLVNDLRSAIKDDLLLILHPPTIDELMYYTAVGEGKYEAAPGKNDDLVIALALALQMALQRGFSRLGKNEPYKPEEAKRKIQPGSFAWWGRLVDRAQELSNYG